MSLFATGLTAARLNDPTSADFGGGGLSMLTRTNPNALRADGDETQGAAIIPTGGLSPTNSPIVWVGIAIGVLLIVKFWSERKTDDHVGDIRIGITNLAILAVMVAIARHLSLAATGLAVKAGIPGSTQASRFFAL